MNITKSRVKEINPWNAPCPCNKILHDWRAGYDYIHDYNPPRETIWTYGYGFVCQEEWVQLVEQVPSKGPRWCTYKEKEWWYSTVVIPQN